MAKKKWKANVELLEQVAKKLSRMRHPRHFEMQDFASQNECGTAACVGGHGLILKGYRPIFTDRTMVTSSNVPSAVEFMSPEGKRVDAWPAARRLFGLSAQEAINLFIKTNWPDQFGPHQNDNPKVAVARIRHFIATEGQE